MANEGQKSRRRWLQISLRELCLVILIVALGIGWWLDRQQLARHTRFVEHEAEVALELNATLEGVVLELHQDLVTYRIPIERGEVITKRFGAPPADVRHARYAVYGRHDEDPKRVLMVSGEPWTVIERWERRVDDRWVEAVRVADADP